MKDMGSSELLQAEDVQVAESVAVFRWSPQKRMQRPEV